MVGEGAAGINANSCIKVVVAFAGRSKERGATADSRPQRSGRNKFAKVVAGPDTFLL